MISVMKAGIWRGIKFQRLFLIRLETVLEENRKDGALGLGSC